MGFAERAVASDLVLGSSMAQAEGRYIAAKGLHMGLEEVVQSYLDSPSACS